MDTNTGTLTRDIILQYKSMQKELEIAKKDFEKTEDELARLISEGTVCDKVKGGYGGEQGFKIEGFPVVEFERRMRILKNKKNRLIKKENDLEEIVEKIEVFIDQIPVSRDRRIFKAIYIDRMSQQEIADELCVDRSLISKIISKYL